MKNNPLHRTRRRRIIFVCLIFAFVASAQFLPRTITHSYAAAPAPTGNFETGITQTFAPVGSATITLDAHPSRLVALYVPAGTPPSPALPPGPFIANWTGFLKLAYHDEKLFAAEGAGDLLIKLNDVPILDLHGDFTGHPGELVQLKKGRNLLRVTYTSPAQGDASLRLLWADKGKTFDPITPVTFQHNAGDDMLVQGTKIRAGRELVATLRCFNCHQSPEFPASAMPELRQDAPNLSTSGARLQPRWIAHWIANPQSLWPGSSMPRVFPNSSAESDPRVWDIAAYLTADAANLGDQPPVPSDLATVSRGARLFTGLGCVGCHIAPDIDDSNAALNRVPLKFVKTKYRPMALKAFLLKPEEHFAWIKMPNFHFTDAEATALTAYLLKHAKDDAILPVKMQPGDPARGKALFESVGCTNCHANTSGAAGLSAIPLHRDAPELSKANFTRGCLADAPDKIGKRVDYQLTPEQRDAIRAFAAADFTAIFRDNLADFAARQRTAVRCVACHSIDDRDNDWSSLDQEVGPIEQELPPDDQPAARGDQGRPPLTWAGERLRSQWSADYIAGKIPYKVHYWLQARMPAFPARAALIAAGMAMEHGCSPLDPPQPPADPALVEMGKTLAGRSGFTCIQCHGVAADPPLAQQWLAPNFDHVTARFRHEFYLRWVRRPAYYMPGTSMPQFADPTGKTAVKSILNGDADPQYEAIWQYLLSQAQVRSK